MGAVDTPERRQSGKKKGLGLRRQKRRVGIRIDMTPMVDIAFLLLIFFMVTTVFRTPQALEINLPPDKESKVEVAKSKVLTIRILADDRVYWQRGETPFARTTVAGIKDVLAPYKGQKELIVIVKIDREAKFNNMVEVLDDLDLAQLSRFSLGELTPEEKKEVEAL